MESTTLLHEQLSEHIQSAAEQVITSLNAAGKLYFVASAPLAGVATQVVSNLMSLKLDSQPALPALLLNTQQTALNIDYESTFMQLDSVLTDNDCVILLDDSITRDSYNQLGNFFSGRSASCIGVMHANQEFEPLNSAISQLHVIPLSTELTMQSIARKQELSLFILNCLSAMIEETMFGGAAATGLTMESF